MASMSEDLGPPRPRENHRRGAACLSCRRQKIRCTMPDSGPPCTRCDRRSLTCEVEALPQLITDNDNIWMRKVERDIMGLRREVQTLSRKCARFESAGQSPGPPAPLDGHLSQSPRPIRETQQGAQSFHRPFPEQQPEPADRQWQVVMGPDSGLGDIPGSCVSQVTSAPASGYSASTHEDVQYNDIVSKGIVSKEKLQGYLEIYLRRFDHFLYRILGDRHSLESMRASSPLLTAAVCAVVALHTNSGDFTACYDHFVSLAEKKMFSRENSIDDVLALVIGAYWLNDISWPLASAAVRMAIDCQLHKSTSRALDGNRTHYLRTRLYYLVFVCDHHYSIVYGRPPLTKRCDAIRAAPAFCNSPHATPDDLRITFQIEFWSLMEDIWDAFGIDIDKRLDQAGFKQIGHFSIRLETIRSQWADRFESSPCVGNYATKGSAMYYHFAKLYLFTHALRGLIRPSDDHHAIDMTDSVQLDHATQEAIASATATIRTVIADKEVQSWLNGFHSYYHMMVAFAAVFLLKICKHFNNSQYYDVQQIHRLLENLVVLLNAATINMHPGHWLVGITRGIKRLLDHVLPTDEQSRDPTGADHGRNSANNPPLVSQGDEGWMVDGVWNGFDIRDFDLLAADSMVDVFPPAQ